MPVPGRRVRVIAYGILRVTLSVIGIVFVFVFVFVSRNDSGE